MPLSTFLLIAGALFFPSVFAAFSLTHDDDSFIVDAGSTNSLVVKVSRTSCDITSIVYRGEELQYTSQGSHIASGLGTATVTGDTYDSQYAKITCKTDTLTHYIVVKSGDSALYMATYTTAEPEIGELRFIARLNADTLPSEYPFGDVSNIADGVSNNNSDTGVKPFFEEGLLTVYQPQTAIEGSDVYEVDGETRSKFYSSERFIDDQVHCVYSDEIHACMVLPDPAYEASSGGPFHRDINTNNVGDYTGLYFYMNSNHVQTESYRQGLHGPYVIAFSRTGVTKASEVDASFFADIGITGYASTSERGYVSGTITGVENTFDRVVHWYNDDYQYWTYASSSGGGFTSPAMRPGTYAMILYQTELQVAESSVTVTAGSTKSQNIASTLSSGTTLFQIGDWDGQPTGFRNAANQLRMHPSDSRMSSWGPLTYTVGSSALTDVPMALFMGVNDPLTISFDLTSSQVGAATLRIGTTLAYLNGRPQATINDYTGDAPAAPTKIDSRGVTRGAYRGYGEIYDVNIPEGTLVSGTNTITINAISGSAEDEYLSPNFILDAIELYQ